MSCLYCGKDIPPFRLLRDDDFCSSDHRELHTARLRKVLISLAEPDPPPAGIADFHRSMPLVGSRTCAFTIDSFFHPEYAPYHPGPNRIPALPMWRESFSRFSLEPSPQPSTVRSTAGWQIPDSNFALPDSVRLRAIDGLGELDAGGLAPVAFESAAAFVSMPIVAAAPVHRGEMATEPPAHSAPALSEAVFAALPAPVVPAAGLFAAIGPVPDEPGLTVSPPRFELQLSANDRRVELVPAGIIPMALKAIPGASNPASPSITRADAALPALSTGSAAVAIDAPEVPTSAGPALLSVDAASGTTTLASPAGPLRLGAAIGRPAFHLTPVDLRFTPELPSAAPYPMAPAPAQVAGEAIASIESIKYGSALQMPPAPLISGPLPAAAGPASVRFEIRAGSMPVATAAEIGFEPSPALPACAMQLGGDPQRAEPSSLSEAATGDVFREEAAVECAGPVLLAMSEAAGNRAPLSAMSPATLDSTVGRPEGLSLALYTELPLAAAVPAGVDPVAPAAQGFYLSSIPAKPAGSAIQYPRLEPMRAAESTCSPVLAAAALNLPEPAHVLHRPAPVAAAPIELDSPVRLSLRGGAGEIDNPQFALAPAKALDLIPAPLEGVTGGGLLSTCATNSVSLPNLTFGLAQPPVDYAADLSPAAVAVDSLPSAARPTLRIAGTALPQFMAPAPAVLATAPVVQDATHRPADEPSSAPPEVKLAPAAPELPAACQPGLTPAVNAGLEFISANSAMLPEAPVERSAVAEPEMAGAVPVEFYIQRGRLTPARRETWNLPRPDALLPRMSINAVSTPPSELLQRLQPGKDKVRVMPANGRSDTIHWAKGLAAGIAVCAFLWFGSLALRSGNEESTGTPSGAADSIALTAPPSHQDGGVLSNVRRTIAKRAKLEVSNDFRSGKDFWDGSRAAWGKGWERHADGYTRPGALALLRPTIQLTDYRMEFMAQIENKSMSWVVRAHDTDNYYAMKLNVVTPGLRPIISVVRYHVVNGKRGRRVEIPLPVMMHNQRPHRVAVDVRGNRIVTSVEGEQVDSWVDDALAAGGVGFFSEGAERARLYWVKVTNNDDLLGRICAYLAGRPRNGTESAFSSGGPEGRPGRGTPVHVAALPAWNELRRSRTARVRTQIG